MTDVTLAQANVIIENALKKGEEMGFKPLTVAVLDSGGHLKALARADGASTMRPEMAAGKAYGCIALGVGGRWINQNGIDRGHFMDGVVALSGGKVLPVPGGVLIKDGGEIIGAVGITGDTSDNDEAAAVAGVEAANLTPDVG
ncbi:MAG: heme-binding protein [Hyphomicrobiales bacterium]